MLRSFRIFLILSVFFFGFNDVSAQRRGFQQGYIITHNGDSVYGLIKDRASGNFPALYNRVRFKAGGKSRTQKFGPEDILGYGFAGRHFVALPFREESNFFKFRHFTDSRGEMTFLKVIQRSPQLVHYEYLFVDDESSYLDAFPLFHRPGSREMVRVTQGIFGFRKKILSAYFSDCPELVSELARKKRSFLDEYDLYNFYLERCGD